MLWQHLGIKKIITTVYQRSSPWKQSQKLRQSPNVNLVSFIVEFNWVFACRADHCDCLRLLCILIVAYL